MCVRGGWNKCMTRPLSVVMGADSYSLSPASTTSCFVAGLEHEAELEHDVLPVVAMCADLCSLLPATTTFCFVAESEHGVKFEGCVLCGCRH